jgi:transcriptional regulator with XRE-family HTH domain
MNKRKEIIPNNLKEYRLKAGLTQKQVAELVGVNNQERICHWEAGRNVPSALNLMKLCDIYKTNPSKLYFGERQLAHIFMQSSSS